MYKAGDDRVQGTFALCSVLIKISIIRKREDGKDICRQIEQINKEYNIDMTRSEKVQ